MAKPETMEVCQWCHGNPCTCPKPVQISDEDMHGVFGYKCDQPTCPACTGMTATEWAELYERAATSASAAKPQEGK
jgi:hypothetical protein